MSRTRVDISNTHFCYDAALADQLAKISRRVQDMRSSGALSPDVLHHIRRFFRIKNIYHSNAIEGNQLSLGETQLVVQQGMTITGKPLKDQAEAKNLNEAITFLEELASESDKPITEADLRQIHRLVLKAINDSHAGKYRTVQVEIAGSKYLPPPEQVPIEMESFARWLKQTSVAPEVGTVEGLLHAAVAHTWLVQIHPFIDGNGRVARLLMNLILMRFGYPIAVITKEDRFRYYDSLEESQSSDLSSFLSLLSECVLESLEQYEDAVREQQATLEWAQSLAARLDAKEKTRYRNEYEVWKSAMDLLKGYFRQIACLHDEQSDIGNVHIRDFGALEFEKHLSLRQHESAKKTWFFRLDVRAGERAARYLLFFGYPSYSLRSRLDVTLHAAREDPPGSFYYERLDNLNPEHVPPVYEIGYLPNEEKFIVRGPAGRTPTERLESIVKPFFNRVIELHFGT